VKITRLSSCKNFVRERSLYSMRSLTFSQWRDLRTGVILVDLGALTNTNKRVLNLLEPVKLTVWKVMIERVTVVKFRVNYGSGNGAAVLKSMYGRIQRRSWM